MLCFRAVGWCRLTALVAAVLTIFELSLGGDPFRVSSPSAAGMMQTRDLDSGAIATPVAPAPGPATPLENEQPDETPREAGLPDSDPLDGDPLDGRPVDDDIGAPADLAPLEIVRSGRPNDAPSTVAAYDDDPATTWIPEADSAEAWLWLDLGSERRLRNVRWLAQGAGAIEVSLSSDRQRWRTMDWVDIGTGWHGLDVHDVARYVRLTLLPDDDGNLPAIAETSVYGPERDESFSSEQEAGSERRQKRERRTRDDNSTASEQEVDDQEPPVDDRGGRSNGRVRVSTEPGETRCSGNRERCEARQGEVRVEEDCAAEGSCTIDVRADGGTAICDASGGDRTETGDGEGKRGGRGGRCEAVANGGAVTIGDIDP